MNAKTRGNARALVEELKDNSRLCWLVIEDDVAVKKIIPSLSYTVYDRLNKAGFDFNALKRKKIRDYAQLKQSDLESWTGKSTHELIENIYDKIKNLKTTYKYAPDSGKHRWKARVINIQKRILLLVKHLRD